MILRHLSVPRSSQLPFLGLLAISFILLLTRAEAGPLAPEQVPEPLKPWVDWVLFDKDERACPHLYNAAERRCAWPGALDLRVEGKGGAFSQTWQVYRESWISLPGGDGRWPQSVLIDGEAALVTQRQGRPVLKLAPGTHRLSGRFFWKALPETLPVPPDTGLIDLRVDGNTVPMPDREADGALWLRERSTRDGVEGKPDQSLELSVFRRVVDDNPMRVITRILIEASGTPREAVFRSPLLEGAIPLAVRSPLPARLENSGQLRIQLRPGRWQVDLTTRFAGEVSELRLGKASRPWPDAEVWVFEGRAHLRLVEVAGLTSVDPRRTRLPPDWQHLPAYRVGSGEAMRLKLMRRGDPDPEPDRLALRRELWLDFDGAGYTFRDHISGSMTRGWRLEVDPPMQLGRVLVAGQPQFITRLPGSNKEGVEVRRGALDLVAESRFTGARQSLPAVGWDRDFQQVSALLHLPPGWKLLAASGMDNVSQAWLQRWTLLDLFLVLIAALAVRRLWGWHWGGLALITLALIWHESGAPHYAWLNILAAVALLRVLPEGRSRRVVRWYRNGSLLALLLIALPFVVDQVRQGLYPQLERPRQVSGAEEAMFSGAVATREIAKAVPRMMQSAADSLREEDAPATPGAVREKKFRASATLEAMDPKALIQTGPGLPGWQWTSIPLSWSGPVARGQTIGLTLLTPAANLALNLLRVLLVGTLILRLLDQGLPRMGKIARAGVATLGMGSLLLVLASDAGAAYPSQELLGELETRLLAPPDCLPGCAQAPRLVVEISDDRLVVRLEVHALASVAIPLPGDLRQWMPGRVLVDGESAAGLSRADNGRLWIQMPAGRHQVVLEGPPPPHTHFQLPLPLRPRWAEAKASGWRVEGIDQAGVPDARLQFVRLQGPAAPGDREDLEPSVLPVFVRVERTLRLGLDWRVDTRVVRVSPRGTPLVLEVPLIDGESVISEGVRTRDGRALVSMGPDQMVFRWQSGLARVPRLTLTASADRALSEVWRAEISPIWHLVLSGIPVVHHQDPTQRWLPEWRPWPGEKVSLEVSRPAGVAGPTLTVDTSQLEMVPGKRATDVHLSLRLRSSQGGQHVVRLPEGAELQSVSIDGSAQPIRQLGREITLPLVPGTQAVELLWRSARDMGIYLQTPPVDLGTASVNSGLRVKLGTDRWILLLGGPALGPAVLFWGVLLVIVLLALVLGRVRLTPLKSRHWFLLGIGLSQSPVWVALIVAGWLLALGARERFARHAAKSTFNVVQIGLAILTLMALVALFSAVEHGLLGLPQMQIAGNQSSPYELNWYQDRSAAELARAWIISVPLLVYRLLMLAWALWLAFSLLRWLRWGWQCYSAHGIWREIKMDLELRGRRRKGAPKDAPAAKTPDADPRP